MVNLLACRVRGLGSSPGLTTAISEIEYLLLPNRDMTEILLKQGKILKTTQPKSKLEF